VSALILIGDGRALLGELPGGSVQCVVTSPPYWGLRSYLAADDPNKHLEIGQEPTLGAYVENLVGLFRAVWRVLHPPGTVFLNLGDAYANTGTGGPKTGLAALADQYAPRTLARNPTSDEQGAVKRGPKKIPTGLKHKDLLMLPARVALALQDDGWWIRSHIAWVKDCGMPESVKDRPTQRWESVFMLTKNEAYFWDQIGAAEPSVSVDPKHPSFRPNSVEIAKRGRKTFSAKNVESMRSYSATRNMTNVWRINPKPFKGAHFATFPPDLPRKAIQAATSDAGCCPSCRSPFRRIIEKGDPDLEHQLACGSDVAGEYDGQATKDYAAAGVQNASDVKRRILAGMVKKTTIGWEPTCQCPPLPPVPCLVLDPFGGSGTTGAVAESMGRDSIMVDLKPEYVALAIKRLGRKCSLS
jgi:DNA modification methylase